MSIDPISLSTPPAIGTPAAAESLPPAPRAAFADRLASPGESPAGGSDGVGLLAALPRLDALRQRLAATIERGRVEEAAILDTHGANSDAYAAFRSRQNESMLLLQLDVQGVAFQAELAAKLVEHTTSGTRSVLQTQM